MNWFFMFLFQNLALSRWLGWAIFSVAGATIVLGLRFGRLFARVNRALQRARSDQELTLTQLYPDWPTWWIPESVEGFVAWLFVAGAGAWLAYTAKLLQKQCR